MNAKDIPPTVLARSYLEAAAKAGTEAVVIYFYEKEGQVRTTALSNKGPESIARAAAALKIGDGAVEKAASSMHEMKGEVDGETVALGCPVCGQESTWDSLPELDRDGHREIVKFVITIAMSQTGVQQPLVRI